MFFDRKELTNDQLVTFYRQILLPRMIEEKMLVLLRQGKISKWFSGIGQEAIAVGAALAMQEDEWLLPLHRNLGVFTSRKMPLHKLFLQWQGHPEGYSKGRERSFHFGSKAHHICGMISHLGPQLAIADGIALAHLLAGEEKASLVFTGEGGTSEGDFHEALNVAAVWNLPVIFVIENNGYGLSTPVEEQYRCSQLVDRAKGYGMEGVRIDGNNLLTVYDTIRGVREYCVREKKPYLIECMTFRMRGHEEASGTKYVPAQLFETWGRKDPVVLFENWLMSQAILDADGVERERQRIRATIEEELQLAGAAGPADFTFQDEIADVYAPASEITGEIPGSDRELRFIDAIKEALDEALQTHENLILMGQDIGAYGGAFKITDGLADKYGVARVRNTPLCESAILGAALGLSLEGYKAMVEMQFADFVSVGFNQIVNNLAKLHYRWGQSADVVVRLPTGAGVGAGPFHSQSNEAWFTHVPGLKVVYPSSPQDAKGLLLAAFADPNPVLFFEHKALYRSITGIVPDTAYQIPIGKARQVHQGNDISIITYGAGVHWALEFATAHMEIGLDIVDLRTLQPLDYDAIRQSVMRTGKVIVLHEDTLTGGFGGEIAAWIGEHCFEYLDAPVTRCAALDTPVPFNTTLETQFLPKARLREAIQRLVSY
ncbi:alpha-ketoacid dehydrogenase subunit alpha/beta [Flavihumibacter petaseus]|uniref:Branched-chain alpha-keto acid dehydrogenase E1 component n=1 Tax=Flavihumibacter petaseus NBRC 106054 TaxID=1220578 RepID=A0A0E9MXN8_9BACT|nr:dehydrogenase E1 component subunit alpha/beta [Flavihumibacter petaseus]GAO42201.1 branched-chain alpha-keto acid dehydrogenase E1 component [Flavihumibacter petaseus NBRC 106054]